MTFQVSVSTVKRHLKRVAQTGRVAATVPQRAEPKIRGDYLNQLRVQVERMDAASLAQRCAAWEQTTGMRVSTSTMCRALARLKLTLEKEL